MTPAHRASLFGAVSDVLDVRLERGVSAPVAVAFSGGGYSLALLLAAVAWADGAGRRLIALTVDHGLQAAAAQWSAWCKRRAGEIGVDHRILEWRGDKPVSGLPNAARNARHGLIGDAAREAERGSFYSVTPPTMCLRRAPCARMGSPSHRPGCGSRHHPPGRKVGAFSF